MERKCENCKYWEETSFSSIYKQSIGLCHRWPPIFQVKTTPTCDDMSELPDYHIVNIQNGWCGEFKKVGRAGKDKKAPED